MLIVVRNLNIPNAIKSFIGSAVFLTRKDARLVEQRRKIVSSIMVENTTVILGISIEKIVRSLRDYRYDDL